MPLTLRLVKGSTLTYAEGDNNLTYLLTNMSGSVLSLTGNTNITGSTIISETLTVKNIPQTTTATRIVVIDTNNTFQYRTDLSLTGSQGPSGSQGPQGIQGPSGSQGPQGPQGIQGPSGSQGPQGPQGIQGPSGSQGPQGIQGPSGSQGPSGPGNVTGSAGQVAFFSGTSSLTGSNNIFWDKTNNRLGIGGLTSPNYVLDVISSDGGLKIKRNTNIATQGGYLIFAQNNSSNNNITSCEIRGGLSDATALSEQGYYSVAVTKDGVLTERLRISNTGNTTLTGNLAAVQGSFRSPSTAIGLEFNNEYTIPGNPKAIVQGYGESVRGGIEFRQARGSGLDNITSLYLNPSGSANFYYDACFGGNIYAGNAITAGSNSGYDVTYITGGSGFGSRIETRYATGVSNNTILGNGDNNFNAVTGNSYFGGNLTIGNGTSNNQIQFITDAGTSYHSYILNSTNTDYLAIAGGSSTDYNDGASISVGGADRYGPYTFGVVSINAGNGSNNTTLGGFIQFKTQNTERLKINWDGTSVFTNSVTATAFYESSDERYKNILSRTETVGNINMVSFKWKPELKRDDKTHFGYIAQEVENIYPDTVITDGDGYKSVNYIELLVKQVSDLQREVTLLKQQINGK
jgi:hypothetical protein